MKNHARNYNLTLGFAIVALFAVSMPVVAQNRHTVTIVNASGYTFYQIKLSRGDDEYWGPDLLAACGFDVPLLSPVRSVSSHARVMFAHHAQP